MNYNKTILAAAFATALLSTSAFAGTFTLTENSVNGVSGTITDVASAVAGGGNSLNTTIGPFNMTIKDNTTLATVNRLVYCSDIFDFFANSSAYVLNTFTSPATTGISNDTSFLSAAKTNQIIALLANAPTGTTAQSAALQEAIWEVENEPSLPYNVLSGNFYVTNVSDGTIATQANLDLANISGGSPLWTAPVGYTLDQYVNPPNDQSFLYLDPTPKVPEPASLALLGVGMLGLGAIRFTKRRA